MRWFSSKDICYANLMTWVPLLVPNVIKAEGETQTLQSYPLASTCVLLKVEHDTKPFPIMLTYHGMYVFNYTFIAQVFIEGLTIYARRHCTGHFGIHPFVMEQKKTRGFLELPLYQPEGEWERPGLLEYRAKVKVTENRGNSQVTSYRALRQCYC